MCFLGYFKFKESAEADWVDSTSICAAQKKFLNTKIFKKKFAKISMKINVKHTFIFFSFIKTSSRISMQRSR